MTRPEQNMDLETFKKIVREAAENGVYSISMYCLGEPFMNPDLREMIIFAKRMGIPYVDVSTNGTFDMTSALGTGLNEIIVNAYTPSDAVHRYELMCERDDLDHNHTPLIRLQLIDLPQYKERNEKIIKNIEYFDADVVYLKNVEVFSQSLGDKNLSQEEIDKRMKDRKACKQLYFVLTVNSNGDIAYCCHDPKGKSVLGNLKDMTLKEAWDKMAEMRECHLKGVYTELCRSCCDWSW